MNQIAPDPILHEVVVSSELFDCMISLELSELEDNLDSADLDFNHIKKQFHSVLARCYLLTGDARFASLLRRLLRHPITQPPVIPTATTLTPKTTTATTATTIIAPTSVLVKDLAGGEVYAGDDVDAVMRDVISQGLVTTNSKLLGPLLGALLRLHRNTNIVGARAASHQVAPEQGLEISYVDWMSVSIPSMHIGDDCGLSPANVVAELCYALDSADSPLCAKDQQFIPMLAFLMRRACAEQNLGMFGRRNGSVAAAGVVSVPKRRTRLQVTLAAVIQAAVVVNQVDLTPGTAAERILEMVSRGYIATTSDRISILLGALIHDAFNSPPHLSDSHNVDTSPPLEDPGPATAATTAPTPAQSVVRGRAKSVDSASSSQDPSAIDSDDVFSEWSDDTYDVSRWKPDTELYLRQGMAKFKMSIQPAAIADLSVEASSNNNDDYHIFG